MSPQPSQPRPSMPARGGTSVLAKLGDQLRRAVKAHKNDATKISPSGDLPPGLTGVAQLNVCRFDVHKDGDNAGKPYWIASGIIHEPHTFKDKQGNTHKVSGRRTSIQCPLYETPKRSRKNVQEHVAWMLNEFRKLGVDTSKIPDDIPDGCLEMIVTQLQNAKPYFQFHTFETKGAMPGTTPDANSEPMLIQMWDGVCAPPTVPELGAGIKEPSANGHTKTVEPSLTEEPPPAVEMPEPAEPEAIAPEDVDRGDITSLVERALQDDTAAQEQLIAMAVAAGHDEADARKSPSWDDVAILAQTPAGGGEEGESEGESESSGEIVEEAAAPAPVAPPPPAPKPAPAVAEPVKGKTCKFRPLGADKVTRAKKPVDCEIVSINKAAKTVNLKSLVDGKLYNNVKWDILNK